MTVANKKLVTGGSGAAKEVERQNAAFVTAEPLAA